MFAKSCGCVIVKTSSSDVKTLGYGIYKHIHVWLGYTRGGGVASNLTKDHQGRSKRKLLWSVYKSLLTWLFFYQLPRQHATKPPPPKFGPHVPPSRRANQRTKNHLPRITWCSYHSLRGSTASGQRMPAPVQVASVELLQLGCERQQSTY